MDGNGGRRGPDGAWRLLSASPAALLSGMLVTIVFSPLEPYTPLAVASWLVLVPLLLLTRPAERLAVRAVYRFRPPTRRDDEWLTWLRRQTEIHCGTPAGHLDWYVRDDPTPNAFAAGRHSIALTTGFLRLVYAGRLTPDQAVAVAVHEVGHHVTRGPRYGLVVDWLSWPWRTVYWTAIRIGHALPLSGAGMLLMPVVFALAIVSIVRAGGPPGQVIPVLIALVAVALAVTVDPVVDAALTRASEYAADAYTAGLGMGPGLAVALHVMSPVRQGTPPGRACDTHPAIDARLRRLIGTVGVTPTEDRSPLQGAGPYRRKTG